MANEEQLSILRQGVDAWNKWRAKNGTIRIDLSKADLQRANLVGAHLLKADLSEAHLQGAKLIMADLRQADITKANLANADLRGANLLFADLTEANLSKANLVRSKLMDTILSKAIMTKVNLKHANLTHAHLSDADLRSANLNRACLREASVSYADFTGADLREAYFEDAKLWGTNLTDAVLTGADFTGADLTQANLTRANLSNVDFTRANFHYANMEDANLTKTNLNQATFVETWVDKARISGSSVYGISVWNLNGEFGEQKDLIISPEDELVITVDNVEVAQFIYLILNNKKVRDVINTLTSKTVLILGRFAIPERKAILDALRNKLREYDLLPIVFDFDRPTDKDFTETIKTLAGISYFVIADVTNPKSSPLELQATVPDYQIPFVPIIQEGESPFAMMVDLQKKYPWVLPTRSYDSIETLMSALKSGIIDPAVEMRNKLRLIKAQEQVTESLRDYVDKTL